MRRGRSKLSALDSLKNTSYNTRRGGPFKNFHTQINVLSLFSSVTQACLTLCDPMDWGQGFLSITNSRNLLKLMSIESVIPSNHLILCCPLLLLTSVFPSIRVFSNESVFHIRQPKYWSFSFSMSFQ